MLFGSTASDVGSTDFIANCLLRGRLNISGYVHMYDVLINQTKLNDDKKNRF